MNVESKVLINLESVKHNYLKLRESGLDEALRLPELTTLFLITSPEARYTNARQLFSLETLIKRFACAGISLMSNHTAVKSRFQRAGMY